jgi:hypothetical protein
MYTPRGVKHFAYAVLFLSGIFLAGTTPAFAQTSNETSLVSLVKNSQSSILSAVISCNRANINKALGSLEDTAANALEAVPVSDKTVTKNTNKTAASAQASQQKFTCTQAIERAAAQALLKELTMRTVNWINNGFQNGKSIFVGDTGSVLKELHDQQLSNFSSVLGFDPQKFPFGKQVAIQLLSSSKRYFENDMQYSLSKIVSNKYHSNSLSGLDFEKDFAIGGWDAFMAQSLPQNNPYGFQLAAQDEAANIVRDTQYSVAQDIKDQIQRGMGFMDQKRCVNPQNWNADAYAEAIESARDSAERATVETNMGCKKWETYTPGSVAANQLYTVLGSPLRQLEMGNDLQASFTAVFDALTSQLLEKGLKSLKTDSDYTPNNGYQNNFSYIQTGQGDNYDDGSWYGSKDFNLLDVTGNKGLLPVIDTENKYADLLEQENGQIEILIPAIYELDMCIPGPNPDWQASSADALQNYFNNLPKSADEVLSTGSKIVSKIFDPMGMLAPTIKDESLTSRNKRLYTSIVEKTLGVNLPDKKDGHLGSFSDLVIVFERIYKDYSAKIHARYDDLAVMPTPTYDSRRLYRQIPSYSNTYDENAANIDKARNQTVKQLNRLVELIKALPPQDDPTYTDRYNVVYRTFKRLAPDFHNQDDLVAEQDRLEQLQDQIKDIKRPNGYLDQCYNEVLGVTTNPKYNGPNDRRFYPGELLGQTDARSSKLNFGSSFWPALHYARSPSHGDSDPTNVVYPEALEIVGQCDVYRNPSTLSYSTNVFGKPVEGNSNKVKSNFIPGVIGMLTVGNFGNTSQAIKGGYYYLSGQEDGVQTYSQNNACLTAFEDLLGVY